MKCSSYFEMHKMVFVHETELMPLCACDANISHTNGMGYLIIAIRAITALWVDGKKHFEL